MDYVAMVLTAFGIMITGRKLAWGWLVNAIGSAVWFTVAYQHGIVGLCVLNIFLIVTAIYNFYKWNKK